jgi:hypothetical protein
VFEGHADVWIGDTNVILSLGRLVAAARRGATMRQGKLASFMATSRDRV